MKIFSNFMLFALAAVGSFAQLTCSPRAVLPSDPHAYGRDAGSASPKAGTLEVRGPSSGEREALDLRRRFGGYQAEGAIWLEGKPVVVNRDFDFLLAFAGVDFGNPGIAAAQRRRANEALAERFRAVAPITREELVRNLGRQCAAEYADLTRRGGVRIYGLIFGNRRARMRVVVEVSQSSDDIVQYVAVSPSRPAEAFAVGSMLQSTFDEGLHLIASALGGVDFNGASGGSVSCTVGETQAVTGQLIVERPDYRVAKAGTKGLTTYVICPVEAARTLAPAESPD